MSGTTVTGDSHTTDTTGKTEDDVSYILGLTFTIIFILIILSYASYKCTRNISSSPVPAGDDRRRMTGSRGVDDDVLMTFPVFIYSQVMPNKGDTGGDASGSGCSICLVDYKQADVVRLLPECGHLFHRRCIDTWLKVHPNCPMCRNSPLPAKPSVLQS
ncbi:hypothetical protein R6Q59_008708 [Mikania micrantha]|uniref:RING-type domain-containing protein n=1 Tax=Mikania micrantha TaxID=192012 RepID=A0A5N6Q781_9ASTR|nr:hypothetical protein E3N88_03012 [Mikania micrantha]